MPDQELLELYKQQRAGQDKYTYFILAVAASAIAFSVQKTTGLPTTWPMLPLGLATIAWGLSFYFGCKNLIWIQSVVYANFNLLSLQKGVHRDQPTHPQLVQAATEGVRSAIDENANHAEFYAKWQFRLLIIGAVFFLVWHILEMVIQTYATEVTTA